MNFERPDREEVIPIETPTVQRARDFLRQVTGKELAYVREETTGPKEDLVALIFCDPSQEADAHQPIRLVRVESQPTGGWRIDPKYQGRLSAAEARRVLSHRTAA